MKRLAATYSIVTPMFLGDANQAVDGFRVPSFKGALRFWWRALAWAELGDERPADALRRLHQREARLFGWAAGSDGSTQSRVLLDADVKLGPAVPSSEVVSSLASVDGVEGVSYLKGQGMSRRSAISSGRAVIHVCFLPGVSLQDRESVERSLLLLGLLGGLGSRARRGLGSCAILSLEGARALDLEPPRRQSELKPTLHRLLNNRPSGQPPYSACSSQMRVDLSLSGAKALDVLGQGGLEMAAFRRAIKADTGIALDVAANKLPARPPSRSSFGLPLQFYFQDSKTTVFVGPSETRAKRDRRGSPLFLHVHPFVDEPKESAYGLVQTFLPATFLPRGDRVIAKASRKVDRRTERLSSFQLTAPSLDVGLLGRYLDTFASHSGFQRLVTP